MERGVKFVKWGSDWAKAWKDFQAKEPANILESAKKRGVQSGEAILNANVANLRKWEKMVDGGVNNEEKFVEALREHVYSKIKF